MASKIGTSAIFYRIYEETRLWEADGKIPEHVPLHMRKRDVIQHYAWEAFDEVPINFKEFHFFVYTHLKLTEQERIVKQRWNSIIMEGYIENVNESGNHFVRLNLVRPLFGAPAKPPKKEP